MKSLLLLLTTRPGRWTATRRLGMTLCCDETKALTHDYDEKNQKARLTFGKDERKDRACASYGR